MSELTEEQKIQTLNDGATITPADLANSKVGFHYTVEDYYEVSREKVREYARALQDGNPIHWNEDAAKAAGHPGLLAPLTFVSLFGMIAQRHLFEDVVTGYDVSQIMQVDQRIVFHKPVSVGQNLVCDVSLDSFRQMAGTDLMVTKNIVRNQHDELILTTWTTIAARTATEELDPAWMELANEIILSEVELPYMPRTVEPSNTKVLLEVPDAAADPQPYSAIKFDDVSEGQELAPRIYRVTRGNLVNYAGVSGDPNPIHFSDEIAKLAGMKTVVAHGMQTMGIAAGYLTSFVGDPGAVHEFNVRFTSPLYVEADKAAEFELSGKVKSLDPETRTGQIVLTAKQDGRKVFGRATAQVKFG